MVNNLELKEKALNYVKDNRWDFLLVNTFLTIKHYLSLSKRTDFEDEWNIGLKSVSSCERTLVSGYKEERVTFVNATVNDTNFSIGGFSDSTSMPDDSLYVTLYCSLLIDNNVVLTIQYVDRDYESYDASHYTMVSVEELHVDPRIDKVLGDIEVLINEHKKLRDKKEKRQQNDQYDGKFSFGSETNQNQNETTSYKLGKLIGKLVNK
jgi:hypothetical protein